MEIIEDKILVEEVLEERPTVKTKPYDKWRMELNQITDPKFEFFFVNDDYEQVHIPVYCKDYLQDVVECEVHGRNRSIYGFNYKSKGFLFKDNKSFFKMALLLNRRENENFNLPKTIGKEIIDFLNCFENIFNFKKSYLEEVTNEKLLLINSSLEWLKYPQLLSLWSYIVRTGNHYKIGTDPLKHLLSLCSKKGETVVKYSDTTLFAPSYGRSAYNNINMFVYLLYAKGLTCATNLLLEEWDHYKNKSSNTLHDCSGIFYKSFPRREKIVQFLCENKEELTDYHKSIVTFSI